MLLGMWGIDPTLGKKKEIDVNLGGQRTGTMGKVIKGR